jgi:hypothetical protein
MESMVRSSFVPKVERGTGQSNVVVSFGNVYLFYCLPIFGAIMKRTTIHGISLIIGTVGLIITMTIHPTALNVHGPIDELMRVLNLDRLTHSIALLALPFTVFGYAGIFYRLRWNNPWALFGLIVFVFSALAVMIAAFCDGFIAANLIQRMVNVDESTEKQLRMLLLYNTELNQICAKVYVVGSAWSFILWSVAILKLGKFEHIVGFVGFTVGILSLVLLFGVPMNAHGFGLVVFSQAIWSFLLAASLLKSEDSEDVHESRSVVGSPSIS